MIFGKVCVVFSLASLVSAQFIYLNNGVFKFIAGIGLPIDIVKSGSSVSWFSNVQVFYTLPDNITYFEPYKTVQKRALKNIFNRLSLYQAFVKYLDRFGLSGSDCVCRMICEVGARNINEDENGLLGEIVHVLFSPGNEEGLEELKAAHWHGLYNDSSCGIFYKDCYLKENSLF